MENQYIPIDKQLEHFRCCIDNNERIIFSAKFGDGKTYFLNEFFKKNEEDFIVFKLFPVNYQIEGNKDIFELIKRDILIQLLANDYIVNDDNILSNFDAACSYISENAYDIAIDLIKAIEILKVPISIIEAAKKHLIGFLQHKKELKRTNIDIAHDFIRQVSLAKGIYEFDAISELIVQCIQFLKKEYKGRRKIVLLIEDLDRIDPGQIFRILNVLSAHIDRHSQSEADTKNKFGFDKIITVCDYNNIKKIFHHIYGKDTDFTGYIHKFTTTLPFEYSLKNQFREFIFKCIAKDKDFSPYLNCVGILTNFIVYSIFKNSHNLREIKNHLIAHISDIINPAIKIHTSNGPIDKNTPYGKFLVLAIRFGINIDELIESLFDNINFHEIMNLIGENWKFVQNSSAMISNTPSNKPIFVNVLSNGNVEIRCDDRSNLLSRCCTIVIGRLNPCLLDFINIPPIPTKLAYKDTTEYSHDITMNYYIKYIQELERG